jgi:hypothetical protein
MFNLVQGPFGPVFGQANSGAAAPIQTAPTITTTSLPAATVGVAYSAQLAATGNPATFTWLLTSGNKPAWLTVSTGGALSGTPAAGDVTTGLNLTFSCSNGVAPNATSGALSLVVGAAGTLAIITSLLPDLIAYKQVTSFPIEAAGLLPINFSIVGGVAPDRGLKKTTWTGGGLPAGLALDQFTGQLTGAADAVTGASFTIRATNSTGSVDKAFLLNVLDIGSGAPVFVTPRLPRGRVYSSYGDPSYGELYDQRYIYVTGKTPITYSISSGALPPGVTFSSIGLFGGRPTTAGSYTFTVRATNSVSSTDQVFTVEIVGLTSKLPVITTSKVPDMAVGSQVAWHNLMRTVDIRGIANSFVTTNGSNVVVVNQLAHPYLTGENVQISGVGGNTPFNGLLPGDLNGTFPVTYINANSFSIVIAANATGTGSGGSDFKTKLKPTWSTIANANPNRSIPAGLSIDSSSGLISGTATGPAGEYRFLIQVANSSGTDQAEIAMTISDVPVGAPVNLFKPTISNWYELST